MTQLTSGLVGYLQQAMFNAGFYPGALTTVFDANTVAQLDAYWASKGYAAPKSAIEATALLQRSFVEVPQTHTFTLAEMTVIGQAYAEKKGLGVMGWLRRNWPWVVAGGVVVVGGSIGGYYYWQKSQEGGGTGELGDLGCPCAMGLGHGGRTTNYLFPSGKKSGHYRASTGRFHSHG